MVFRRNTMKIALGSSISGMGISNTSPSALGVSKLWLFWGLRSSVALFQPSTSQKHDLRKSAHLERNFGKNFDFTKIAPKIATAGG